MTSPRYGEVLKWLKKHWEWVAAGVVALFAFVLGRRGRASALRTADDIARLKDEEIEIINKTNEDEDRKKKAAVERLLVEKERLRQEYLQAQTELGKETAQRKIELLESAESEEEIDRILLEEFNIKELK